MAKRAKRTPKEYEELSRAVETGDYTVRGPLELGATLRMGRPTKDAPSTGRTPVLPIRLPREIRAELEHRVEAGESSSVSELIRRAVIEYLERHPSRS